MKCLEDIASKWRRTGGTWMPAAWPMAGPEVGDPILPVGLPATRLRWMPYPAPRAEVLQRAAVYLSTLGKEEADPQAINCHGLGRVGYTERRAAILRAAGTREDFDRFCRETIAAFKANLGLP